MRVAKISLLVTVALAVAIYSYRGRTTLPVFPAGFEPTLVAEWVEVSQAGRRIGSMDEPTSIVIFSDYRCRFCEAAFDSLTEIQTRGNEGFELRVRHLPIFGPTSLEAALVAECAADLDDFASLHRTLYRLSDSTYDGRWPDLLATLGVGDTASVRTCVESDSLALATVRGDIRAGAQLGISSSPVLLVDSLLFLGYPGRRYLEAYLNHH